MKPYIVLSAEIIAWVRAAERGLTAWERRFVDGLFPGQKLSDRHADRWRSIVAKAAKYHDRPGRVA